MFSYTEILMGKTKHEGNKCPLFYVMQKAFCQAVHYRFPFVWEQQWLLHDVKSQILLRLNPNFFMSLAISLIFFFFSYYYSLRWGIGSVATTLSFYMVWFFWVDARPYAMWFCFSIMQLLIFLSLLKDQPEAVTQKLYRVLCLVNLLLSFTIAISIAQIAIIAFFLWILKERNFLKHLWVTVIPIIPGFSYYLFIPKALTKYFPLHNPLDLVFACVGKYWLIFFILYFFVVFLSARIAKQKRIFSHEGEPARSLGAVGMTYSGLIAMMYLAAGVLMATLMSRIVPVEEAAHYIHERYFFFLVPVAIIGINMFFYHLVQMVKHDRWMQVNVCLLWLGLLVIGYFDAFIRLTSNCLYF